MAMSNVPGVRLVALVGQVTGDRMAVHTAGYPMDPQKLLPLPDVVLLDAGSGPGVMLFRYTAGGDKGGDSWHPTIADALEKSLWEYRDALGRWFEVPEGIVDAHSFAVEYAASQRKT